MSASNYTWVCFACRTALRKPKTLPINPKCLECDAECVCLGYVVEIPKKTDVRGWHRLRLAWAASEKTSSDQYAVQRVREVHAKEREIAHLQSFGPNPSRQKQIRKLKKEL